MREPLKPNGLGLARGGSLVVSLPYNKQVALTLGLLKSGNQAFGGGCGCHVSSHNARYE